MPESWKESLALSLSTSSYFTTYSYIVFGGFIIRTSYTGTQVCVTLIIFATIFFNYHSKLRSILSSLLKRLSLRLTNELT